MSQLALRLQIEPMRTLAFGAISGTYTAVGTPLSNPARKLFFLNGTDVVLTISDTGTTDKFQLLPSSGLVLDEALNSQGDYTSQGTQFYVKGSPSVGQFNITSWYGEV